MSQAKLAAAKELIQEKRYAEARVLLNTMNNPTATRWLEQLDNLDPPPTAQYNAPMPPVTAEAERYYRAENRKRKRRRLGGGIEMIVMGLGCFAGSVYLASLPKFTIPGSPPPDNSMSILLLAGGVILTVAGIYIIRRRTD